MRTKLPPLPKVKADYLSGGMAHVSGWLASSTAFYLSGIEVLQRREGTRGDVCEIGVHHGLSFLCLALGLPSDERAVAIDVFDGEGNVDGSGKGDRHIFESNIKTHGGGLDRIDVIQASSLDLERLEFIEQGQRFRLFSIDGGHTAEITRNDLRVAERTVVEDGLVVLDDVLNSHWLGVVTGLFDYWQAGGTLVPAVLLPNKLVLSPSLESAANGRRLMEKYFPAALERRDVPLGAHQIDVYGERSWTVVDDAGNWRRVCTLRPAMSVRHRLATRMPALAAAVRPVLARLQSSSSS